MSLYEIAIPQFKNTLTQVEKWLDKAVEFAKAKNFDPNTLLTARFGARPVSARASDPIGL